MAHRASEAGARRRSRRAAGDARRATDRAALLGWLALSRPWASSHPAPTSPRRAAPGTTSSGSPVRSPPDSATPGSTRPPAWAVADLVRVLLSLARPSALRGPASDADARLHRGVAGRSLGSGRDRRQHLGRRRVPRPRPVRGSPSLGVASRRDRSRHGPRRRGGLRRSSGRRGRGVGYQGRCAPDCRGRLATSKRRGTTASPRKDAPAPRTDGPPTTGE